MNNVLWAATRIHRRGTRFYPDNYDERGMGVPATLRIEEQGRCIFRSGGSYDPFFIPADQIEETTARLWSAQQ